MIFYFLFYATIFLILLLKSNKSNKSIYIVFFLVLLLYGCRDYGGVDDFAYMNAFNNANNGLPVYSIDSSFILLSKVLGTLGFNYKSIFMVYAFISFYFMYLVYKNICRNKSDWIIGIVGFITFYFITTITVMRQFTSASILAFAFIMMFNKNKRKAAIYIILATFFHRGAIIGFLILPLINMKINKYYKILLPLTGLIIGYTGLLRNILQAFSIIVPSQYYNYIFLYEQNKPNVGLLHIILFLVYFIQLILDRKRNIEPETEFLEKMEMVYFTTYFIALSDGWISRISVYFILFVPFIFKTFLSRFSKRKDQQLLRMLVYSAFFILFVYQIIGLPSSATMSNLVPYIGSFNFR